MNYDSLLHRPVAVGSEFEKLIPKIKCEFGYSGQGDTSLSIKNMKTVIEQFSWQMSKVATALEQGSLSDTVDSVFDFAFDHFQYKADGEDQYLRSPACSWTERFNGIDCKSYTIIASSILRELGIDHYIRKIKQPGFQPTEYTHVYVVVPLDQTSGSFDKGYYVIDGTVSDNTEPAFLQTSDLFMSGLKHFSSLNGVARYNYPLHGTFGLASGPEDEPAGPTGNGSTQTVWGTATTQAGNYASGYVSQQASGFFKKLSFKKVGEWFSTPMGCWGGTAYTDAWLTQDVEGMGKYCQLVLDEINVALATGNMTAFSNKVCEFTGMTKMFVFCVVAKIQERQWNGCSVNRLQKVALAAQFYHNVLLKAVETWLAEYFNATPTGQNRSFSYHDITTPNNIMPFCGWARAAQGWTVQKMNYIKKQQDIPVFQGTDYLYSLVQTPDNFNPQAFLQGLQTLWNVASNPGSIFNPGAGNGGGTGSGSSQGGGIVTIPKKDDKPQNAGMNLLVGTLVLGALVYGGMEMFGKDKPLKKT